MKKVLFFLILLFGWNAFGQIPAKEMWVPNGEVNSIVCDNDFVYVGGRFNTVSPYSLFFAQVSKTSVNPNIYFPKVNAPVEICIPDGSGGWYIAGGFTKVGDQNRNRLAQINSNGEVTAWNPNPGLTNSSVRIFSLATDGTNVFVAGEFTTIGGQNITYLAKVNNTNGSADASWIPGVNGKVYTIALNETDIFIGGDFTKIGTTTRNGLAKFNKATGVLNTSWIVSVTNTGVRAIALSGSDVYVGGAFTKIGTTVRNYCAKFNITTGTLDANWNPSANGIVNSIVINGSDIFISGNFTTIGTQSRKYIAKLNNTNGSVLANWDASLSTGNKINSIFINENYIYVAGNFTTIANQPMNSIARLSIADATVDLNWNLNCMESIMYSVCVVGEKICIGGGFTDINRIVRNNIVRFNTKTGLPDFNWNPDINSEVKTLAMNGNDLYVGGNFTSVAGTSIYHLAKLNKNDGKLDLNWNPNPNEGSIIKTIAVAENDVFVGGEFTQIGGQSRNGLAKLNNSTGVANASWNPAGNVCLIDVLCVNGSDVYVGGYFGNIGGRQRNNFAKIPISTGTADLNWNPNIYGQVKTIAVDGNLVYFGGNLTSVGGTAVKNLARVNNIDGALDLNWLPEPDNIVNSIAIESNGIFVGGQFSNIGGVANPNIAKLNKTIPTCIANWIPNQNTSQGHVNSIMLNGSDIYIGGGFYMLNDFPAMYFALYSDRILSSNKEVNHYDCVIYPNPAKYGFRLNVQNDITNLIISDINGRVVLNQSENLDKLISISYLPKGMYFVSVTTNNGITTTKKLIKN